MQWSEFTSIPDGTQVKNHGWDQCVALANLFHEGVIGGTFVGVPSAFNWWTDFWSWSTLYNNYVQSGKAIPGAIFVARGGLYDLPNGHIGIVTYVHPNGALDTMEQNAGTWRYVGRYTRDYADMLGFLVPINNPATATVPMVDKKPKHAQPPVIERNRDEDSMIYIYTDVFEKPVWAVFTLGVRGTWWQFTGQRSASQLAQQRGHAMWVSENTWNERKRTHSA